MDIISIFRHYILYILLDILLKWLDDRGYEKLREELGMFFSFTFLLYRPRRRCRRPSASAAPTAGGHYSLVSEEGCEYHALWI